MEVCSVEVCTGLAEGIRNYNSSSYMFVGIDLGREYH